jgi:hypothetical protein
MNLRPLAIATLLVAVACVPRPPIFVKTSDTSDLRKSVQDAQFDVQKITTVNIIDFKRAFEKRYESQEKFTNEFARELEIALALGNHKGLVLSLELPAVEIDSANKAVRISTPNGDVTGSEEYCVVRLKYRVKNSEQKEIISGEIEEKTLKHDFLHPNQSKLFYAVRGVQQHLVDYLRGRMPEGNIQSLKP